MNRKRDRPVRGVFGGAVAAMSAVALLLAAGVGGTADRPTPTISSTETSLPVGASLGSKEIPDPAPVMGWSSWSFLREGANASTVRAEADALVSSGLAAAGYRYVNVDDGWYECPGPQGPSVDAYGRWVVDPTNYPSNGSENGIEALAAYVHGLGLKFGLYETTGISMQAVAEDTPVLGTNYTADEIATSVRANNYNCGGMVALNYSSPGAQDFVDSIVDELASWGVDYVKLDGITNHDVPDLRAWATAIARSGRSIVLDTTEGDFTSKIAPALEKYSNQWEFERDIEINGPDEGSGRTCDATPYTGCLDVFPLTSYVHWKDRFDGVAAWQPYGGPGGFNDFDSIEVGDGPAASGMTHAAEESQLSLWALAASPLILGADLSANISNAYGSHHGLDPRDLALLTNRAVIAVDQDAIDAARISFSGPKQVFAKVEENGDGIVGLFDTDTDLRTANVTITTSATAIGLAPDPSGYWLVDLWTGTTAWIDSSGRISASVPSEGVVLYRVVPATDDANLPA